MPGYWGTYKLAQEAKKRGRSVTQVYLAQLCREGVFPNAIMPARDWLIPEREALEWLDYWVNKQRTKGDAYE